jgi:hypothetical protein
MEKKKQGSAMVLAVLMLAFFMTLSLNMYFLADNKAQRAKARSELSGVVGDIDFSSTLGYYEIYLASEYITDGFLTSPDTATTKVGIAIPSYIEYFASIVNGTMEHTAGSSVTASAIFTSTSAIESIDISKFGELWYNAGRSIGGYSLLEIKNSEITTSSPFATTSAFILAVFPVKTVGEETSITSKYTKNISFPSATGLKASNFEIRAERLTGIKYVSDTEYTIISDSIESVEVINKGNN